MNSFGIGITKAMGGRAVPIDNNPGHLQGGIFLVAATVRQSSHFELNVLGIRTGRGSDDGATANHHIHTAPWFGRKGTKHNVSRRLEGVQKSDSSKGLSATVTYFFCCYFSSSSSSSYTHTQQHPMSWQ